LHQSPYQSIPDDGDSEFPKLSLHRIWKFKKGVIQTLQLFHAYTGSVCSIYIMSPLVVGEEDAFKTMALFKHDKVYNEKVLFITFFSFTGTHNCLGPSLCMLILTCHPQVPVASCSIVRSDSLLTGSMLFFSSMQEYQGLSKISLWHSWWHFTPTFTCNWTPIIMLLPVT
jgi:hypothetical protein